MELNIPPEKMAEYKRGALAREAREREALARRRERAWAVAREAAARLRRDSQATEVILFGSLAHGTWFHRRSDIDLAVAGIPPGAFWRAWAALDELGNEFEIDLVPIEAATPPLRETLEREGVRL